jgi:hypothetical protein
MRGRTAASAVVQPFYVRAMARRRLRCMVGLHVTRFSEVGAAGAWPD